MYPPKQKFKSNTLLVLDTLGFHLQDASTHKLDYVFGEIIHDITAC